MNSQPEQFNTDAEQPKRKSKFGKWLTALLWIAIIVLLAMLCLRMFVVCRITVSGRSMMPNFKDGQKVWISKVKTAKRGDVVVLFTNEEANKYLGAFARGKTAAQGGPYEKLIKRIVATEGDKIWYEAVDDTRCVLVIKTPDGQYIREEGIYKVKKETAKFYEFGEYGSKIVSSPVAYLPIPDQKNGLQFAISEEKAITVKEGCVYVLGDNRFDSNDSRKLGAFKVKQIYGVVL